VLAGELPVAVSLPLANDAGSLRVTYWLYLPKDWTEDNERRCQVGIPKEMGFKTKPEIALEQIQWTGQTDLAGDLVLIDADYGNASELRPGITELGYSTGPVFNLRSCSRSQAHGAAGQPKGRRHASNAISVKELAVR
jgi:SRSO17 transposase